MARVSTYLSSTFPYLSGHATPGDFVLPSVQRKWTGITVCTLWTRFWFLLKQLVSAYVQKTNAQVERKRDHSAFLGPLEHAVKCWERVNVTSFCCSSNTEIPHKRSDCTYDIESTNTYLVQDVKMVWNLY